MRRYILSFSVLSILFACAIIPSVGGLDVNSLTSIQQQTLQSKISHPSITYDWLVEIMDAKIAGKVITVSDPPEPVPPTVTQGIVSWDPVSIDTNGNPVIQPVSYRVVVVSGTEVTEVPVSETSYTILTPGTYRVSVIAVDGNGTRSSTSPEVSVSF